MKPSFKSLKAKIAAALGTADVLEGAIVADEELASNTKQRISAATHGTVLQHLAELPIDNLQDVSTTSLRIETLRRFGFTTVASVYLAGPDQLAKLPGISANIAQELTAIAQQVYAAVAKNTDYVLPVDELAEHDIGVLEGLQAVEGVKQHLRGKESKIASLAAELRAATARTRPASSRLRWLFSNGASKAEVIEIVERVGTLLADPATAVLLTAAEAALRARDRRSKPDPVEDFRRRSSDYYSLLDDLVGAGRVTGDGIFGDELIRRIEDEPLDTGLVKATLRRYQTFGAKFALTQKRVILGDEMGLGKTLQAIAVLAQRHHDGARHTLVVCPASVMVNWQREFAARSSLPVVKMHGPDAKLQLGRWATDGGVGLTTFDTLKTLLSTAQALGTSIDTVVVDEAQYVKNHDTGRAKTLAKWIDGVPYVMLMSGTPLENRVEEFVRLTGLLDPVFAGSLNRYSLAAGPEIFRREVAPIYLRRNAVEVLSELPDLIEVSEYCTWDGADYGLYLDSAMSRNLMGMRRAGFIPDPVTATPNKLERLLEIADEAFASGQKVVVFSYFLDTLQLVARRLGTRAVGPITGATPPSQRQALVDQFRDAAAPVALLGQIQAAGTGLNIQAASVVILCEPQIKPSLETQAIARARRMGQLRTVQVHRLLIPDSVDTKMIAMLAQKQFEFDTYARDSDLADATSSAKDRSEESLAKVIVLEERRRLGLDTTP